MSPEKPMENYCFFLKLAEFLICISVVLSIEFHFLLLIVKIFKYICSKSAYDRPLFIVCNIVFFNISDLNIQRQEEHRL